MLLIRSNKTSSSRIRMSGDAVVSFHQFVLLLYHKIYNERINNITVAFTLPLFSICYEWERKKNVYGCFFPFFCCGKSVHMCIADSWLGKKRFHHDHEEYRQLSLLFYICIVYTQIVHPVMNIPMSWELLSFFFADAFWSCWAATILSGHVVRVNVCNTEWAGWMRMMMEIDNPIRLFAILCDKYSFRWIHVSYT